MSQGPMNADHHRRSSGCTSGCTTGLLILAGLAAMVFVAVKLTPTAPPTAPTARAESRCRRAVQSRLKAPASAKFDDARVSTAVDPAGGWTFHVEGSVDSQNAFGAMLRARYGCLVATTDGETWRMLDVVIE